MTGLPSAVRIITREIVVEVMKKLSKKSRNKKRLKVEGSKEKEQQR